MDKNSDYSNYNSYYNNYFDNFDPISGFNPISQYEQGYMYYRYLTQAVEYKIKCKEYEKLTGKDVRNDRRTE